MPNRRSLRTFFSSPNLEYKYDGLSFKLIQIYMVSTIYGSNVCNHHGCEEAARVQCPPLPPHHPECARLLDPPSVAFSLSKHRHPYLCIPLALAYLEQNLRGTCDKEGGRKTCTGGKNPEQKGKGDSSKIPGYQESCAESSGPVGQSSILTFFSKNGTTQSTQVTFLNGRSSTSVGMSRDDAIDLECDRREENESARGITRLEEIEHKKKTLKAGPWSTELEVRVGQGSEKVGEKRRFREHQAWESGVSAMAASKGKVYVASMSRRMGRAPRRRNHRKRYVRSRKREQESPRLFSHDRGAQTSLPRLKGEKGPLCAMGRRRDTGLRGIAQEGLRTSLP